MIAESLDTVGAARSIVIDEGRRVLAGNATRDQALAKGLKLKVVDADADTLVAVRRTGLTEEQKTALALYDNRAAELAEWDPAMLAALASAGANLTPFWQDEELRALMEAMEEPATGLTDPDAVPALRRTSITRGDVLALGDHRLACGDSTEASSFVALFGEEMADFVVTSPPYNVGMPYGAHDDRQNRDAYLMLIGSVGQRVVERLRSGRFVAWNIGVSPRTFPAHQIVRLEEAGLQFYRQIVWRKSGVSYPIFHATLKACRARHYRPNYQHEFIHVFEKPGDLGPTMPCPMCEGTAQVFRHDVALAEAHQTLQLMTKSDVELGAGSRPDPRYQNDVWDIHQSQGTVGMRTFGPKAGGLTHKGKASHMQKEHPAVFPVEVPRAILGFLTSKGESVCDPFGGAGSTLLACEQTGRSARLVELDAQYCQLIVDRWEAFTGQKAVKLGEVPQGRRPPHGRKKGRAA